MRRSHSFRAICHDYSRVASRAKSRRYVKSTRCLHLFFTFADPETPRADALPVNSIKRFHLHFCADMQRREREGLCIFSPRTTALFLIWHDVFAVQLSLSAFHSARCEIFTGWSRGPIAETSSRSKCNIQLIWICDFGRYECVGNLEYDLSGENHIFPGK